MALIIGSTVLIVSRLRELSNDRDTALAGEQTALRLAQGAGRLIRRVPGYSERVKELISSLS